MRINIASDIHLEFGPIEIKNTEAADVLILSGDICVAVDNLIHQYKATVYTKKLKYLVVEIARSLSANALNRCWR